MKCGLMLFSLMLCSILITACFPSDVQHQLKLQEARKGLEPAVNEPRQFKDFDVVTVKYYESYDDEHGPGPTCYYAHAYFLIGTMLSLPEALDVYAVHLQSSGWVFERDQYKTSKTLIRGMNERAVVYSREPDPDLGTVADYERFSKTYQSLIFLRIDYILPAVKGC